ncbi:NAD-dependent epimerase/dehydratase family protein [uncultured Arcobacter sp.]|uniref:NAD-dependent epimerase/dehydratase family protein n=1 Tax=uncultured Arcobacter sp. TaxID=165434 RepID=UPI0026193DE6|nr:NAD-dependent epimerase/dehydratase family protein [uncultured Arcobacter sp.]
MKIKTLIIGKRSNLSNKLNYAIKDSELIASKSILAEEFSFGKYVNYDGINIIINTFHPTLKFDEFNKPKEYIENSIYVLSLILNQILKENFSKKINKIIYSSSASVYGNNNYCYEDNSLIPMNLPASLKISSEKHLEQFCENLEIDYTIARIFNMYGGDDNFSVISKIIKAAKDKKKITLINNGTSIRDFIHVDDVVLSYVRILKRKKVTCLNIATGKGVSVKMILDYLELHGYSIEYKNIEKKEIKVSTANVSKLNDLINVEKFQRVLSFIETKLKESNIL